MTGAAAETLHLLSAGAAKGVVQALAGSFERETGATLAATFDAAGTIRDLFLGGAACDVVILPAAMLEALAAQGKVERASIAALGAVPTGIAVPSGEPSPAVTGVDGLREVLARASALYCPDIERATAGIHFVAVLKTLGIHDRVAARLRPYANGAAAMAAMARAEPAGHSGAVGCTQVTEILYTPGVKLVAALPDEVALTTTYSAAVSRGAGNPGRARRFAALLTGEATRELRRGGGFE
ncbi:MAG: molybdate ABC transporter substrate-binding protein [Candidatus Levyibacteriota bacterium]